MYTIILILLVFLLGLLLQLRKEEKDREEAIKQAYREGFKRAVLYAYNKNMLLVPDDIGDNATFRDCLFVRLTILAPMLELKGNHAQVSGCNFFGEEIIDDHRTCGICLSDEALDAIFGEYDSNSTDSTSTV